MFFPSLFSWKTSGSTVCQFVAEEAVSCFTFFLPLCSCLTFACPCLFLHGFLSVDNEVIKNDGLHYKTKTKTKLEAQIPGTDYCSVTDKYLLISEWVQYEHFFFISTILWWAWYFVFISFCVGPTKHLTLVCWTLYTDKKLSENPVCSLCISSKLTSQVSFSDISCSPVVS